LCDLSAQPSEFLHSNSGGVPSSQHVLKEPDVLFAGEGEILEKRIRSHVPSHDLETTIIMELLTNRKRKRHSQEVAPQADEAQQPIEQAKTQLATVQGAVQGVALLIATQQDLMKTGKETIRFDSEFRSLWKTNRTLDRTVQLALAFLRAAQYALIFSLCAFHCAADLFFRAGFAVGWFCMAAGLTQSGIDGSS
jgi:hypothetical protein